MERLKTHLFNPDLAYFNTFIIFFFSCSSCFYSIYTRLLFICLFLNSMFYCLHFILIFIFHSRVLSLRVGCCLAITALDGHLHRHLAVERRDPTCNTVIGWLCSHSQRGRSQQFMSSAFFPIVDFH